MKKKKIRKFCRLYKYDCAGCGKPKHRRHFAKQGETMCPACLRRAYIEENQPSLFAGEVIHREVFDPPIEVKSGEETTLSINITLPHD